MKRPSPAQLDNTWQWLCDCCGKQVIYVSKETVADVIANATFERDGYVYTARRPGVALALLQGPLVLDEIPSPP